MVRIIFENGNRLMVSLCKVMLDLLGIIKGQNLSIEMDRKKHQIIVQPENNSPIPSTDEEFSKQVTEFIEHYRPALETLSKK